MVQIGSKWGYIDRTGKVAIEPKFDEVWFFCEGLAPVQASGKWGYIDRTGKIVVEPRFDDAYNVEDGLAAVCIEDRSGYINEQILYFQCLNRLSGQLRIT